MRPLCHLLRLLAPLACGVVDSARSQTPPRSAALGDFATTYYEAEAHTGQQGGRNETTYFPYIGDGYYALRPNAGHCEWDNISVPQDGTYTLLVKYSNGEASTKRGALIVNGVAAGEMTFKTTGDWHTWWNVRATISLKKGRNVIRLTSGRHEGSVHIDNIAVSSHGASSPPKPVFNVKDYGAVGDGRTLDTGAIQAAIDACQNTGGSVVLDGGGTFLTGTLFLKSRMTLWIATGATLKGSQVDLDYPVLTPKTTTNFVWNPDLKGSGSIGRALVHAEGQTNVAISGGGTIDGNDLKNAWLGQARMDKRLRPCPVFIATTKGVRITNIDIVNGAMFTCAPLECDDVVIDGVNTWSVNVSNRDGINVVDSHRVLITNCTIASEDDALCQKSGSSRGIDGYTAANITINRTSCGGIKYGTQSYGPFTNSSFADIAIRGFNGGSHIVFCGIAIESVDGGAVSNIRYERMMMDRLGTFVFLLNGAGLWGRHPSDAPSKKGAGSVSNVLIKDIECRNMSTNLGSPIMGSELNGEQLLISNVTFENVKVSFLGGHAAIPPEPRQYKGEYPEFSNWGHLPAAGYFMRYARDVVFKNCSTEVSPVDARPAVVTR